MLTGAHDVGQREQTWDKGWVRLPTGHDGQGAVGKRDPDLFALSGRFYGW
ncbi:MAG TPA: hypothetical protein VJ820_00995 [Propionibacteriaceae bacterium]|nr:hypothetical protein [Propionibacteriaceae bacterium]